MNYETRLRIKEMYELFMPDIERYYPRCCPYFDDWTSWMNLTRIEENIWHDIRVLGLPFFPQFPVGRYFIDFADPIKKIGIEVDGKYHEKQKNKDEERQKEIENLGWKIIRIDGWKTYKDRNSFFEEDWKELEDKDIYDSEEYEELEKIALQDYHKNCSEGILEKLKFEIYI